MIPKQREMDGIVRQIYDAIETEEFLKSTLLVLCGDHGMNDAGNHGGSAPGETSPALVFISPKLRTITSGIQSPADFKDDFQYYTVVEQSDIAPTLGALIGFPIPRNNLGAFIVQFLPFWANSRSWRPFNLILRSLFALESDRVQILLRNARQILSVVVATFPSFEGDGPSENCHELPNEVDKLACQWRDISKSLGALKNEDGDTEGWLISTSKVCSPIPP
jgi:ethanolaminephosphotransferase